MDSLLIACPNCGKTLRLRDRRLLGRRGRCQRCRHQFILQEPEAPGGMVERRQPSDHAEPSKTAELSMPVPADGIAPNGDLPHPSLSSSPHRVPTVSATDEVMREGGDGESLAGGPVDEDFGVQQLRSIRRRKVRRPYFCVFAGVLLVGLLTIAGFVVWTYDILTERTGGSGQASVEHRDHNGAPDRQRNVAAMGGAQHAQWSQISSKPAEMIAAANPTDGQPIALHFLPIGVNIVVHLRPAELWSDDRSHQEFRAAWGPLADWGEAQIQEIGLFEPAQIDRLLLGVILGIPGERPDVSAVVHLNEDAERRELIQRIGGDRVDEFSESVYGSGERAYLIHDSRTFAVAPRELAGEMVASIHRPSLPAVKLQPLFPHTDRDRHLTLLFSPDDARRHQKTLVPERVEPVFERVMEWFGEDVEAVAWSLHFGEDLYSEMRLRSRNVVKPQELQEQMERKLALLPELMLETVRQMDPGAVGARRIIGRFPAMTKVVSLATLSDTGERSVRLTTVLPERAAPNLAVGTLLSWHESTRSGNGKPSSSAGPGATSGRGLTKEPEPIADRLKKEIEIDFRRVPLQDAFEYIGEVTQVPVEIDGQALKQSGYTKNMPQTFDLGTVPATKALHEIIKQYPQMVLVVDETNQQMVVTTKPMAAQKGWEPFPLK